jgi:hypothetical protein
MKSKISCWRLVRSMTGSSGWAWRALKRTCVRKLARPEDGIKPGLYSAAPRAGGGIGRRARLRALWAVWPVEVRVLFGASHGKPRNLRGFRCSSAGFDQATRNAVGPRVPRTRPMTRPKAPVTHSGTAQVTRRPTDGGREWNSALARRLAAAPPLPRLARGEASADGRPRCAGTRKRNSVVRRFIVLASLGL